MALSKSIVFLLDVDNTLLDNDRVTADLRAHLVEAFGEASAARYWTHFENIRKELGYADYLGALQRYRMENRRDPGFIGMSAYLLNYPFKERLYAGALEAVAHVGAMGPTVILSDGDVVFQPWKVEKSGIMQAVAGRVLIYIHKEQDLDDVEKRFPAEHYVLVDDKIRILTAVKKVWGPRLTTVFVRQGHYATDAETVKAYPPADITIERIGDLRGLGRDAFGG